MSPATEKPHKDTVYIDADDEITAIIDKVDSAKNKVVALVLPKRTTALKSIVNMRLLKRSAENASKNVVLITTEQALLPLAGAAGVHVSKDLKTKPEIPPSPLDEPPPTIGESESSTKIDGSRPIGELALAHEEGEAIDLEEEDAEAGAAAAAKPKKDKKLKVPNFERFRLGLVGGIVGALLLIFLLIFGFFVWPSATIAIQTSSTPVSANFNLTATDKAKTLDETGGNIPASLQSKDQTGTTQVQATGQQNNGTKATGSTTVSNCTNSAVAIPAGTGISANGLTYITQAELDLDSGNFDSHGNCKSTGNHVGTTNIVAQQGGTKYNSTSISNASVAGFPFPGVSASGSASGGTDNNITVVGQSDADGAKQKLTTGQSTNDFTKSFEDSLASQGFYVLTSTLKAGDPQVTANPAVGQQASNTTVTVKVTYTVLAVQKSDLSKAITDQLNKQIDTSKQKISSSDVIKDASVSVQSSSSPTTAVLQIGENTTAVPTLDVNSIKKQAEGLKSADIKSFISNYPGVKNVSVKFSPFWVSKAPKKPSKIHINLQEVKS